ncbi:MAG: hypothetical protein R3B09_23170 [Nannocystaceae bacterium]
MPRAAASLCLALAALACGAEASPWLAGAVAPARRASAEATAAVEADAAPPPRLAGASLRLHDPGDLAAYDDPGSIDDLDLALSTIDRVDLAALDQAPEDPCVGLDLRALAERLTGLRRLRISGCQEAIHAGLDAFTGLEALELADLTLDGVTMGRLLALPRLRALTLTRVTPGGESLGILRSLAIERLALRELAVDSPLVQLITHLPRLAALEIVGGWAAHKTMLAVAQASRLRELALRDTQVGNFSLNQVKGLAHLESIDLRGSTFNDNTPLFLRELPLREFTCACPSLGDNGLRALRRVRTLQRVALLQSRLTGAGVEALAELPDLKALTVDGRDVGPQGLAALAKIPALRELELRPSEPADPSLAGLGALVELRRLTLGSDDFGDAIAGQLAPLHALERLDLGGTAISDQSLGALVGMSDLRELILHHTRVTNRGLAHLSGLRHLEVLELDHTDVVDAGVDHLKDLPELRELRLDATLVTDRAIDALLTLQKLERLNLAGTVITREGAARLRALPQLRAVNLAGTRAAGP